MPSRLQVSADFRPWRVVCLLLGAGLIVLGLRFLAAAFATGGFEAVGAALVGTGLISGAAICIAPSIVGAVARPLTGWFGDLFYPTETLRQPPEDLLRALRMRLRDRYWEAVDQQTAALLSAYGPSAELYHLRAHLEAGRTGDYSAVTVEASAKLSQRAFALYTELLDRDPPPRTVQTGIDA